MSKKNHISLKVQLPVIPSFNLSSWKIRMDTNRSDRHVNEGLGLRTLEFLIYLRG